MSIYGLELHKFVIGDTRVDGWKSGWRIEQERRRAEEMQNRKFVTAPQIKERQERCRPARVSRRKVCAECKKVMRSGTISDICFRCMRNREKCECGRTIYKGNSLTQCKQCHNRDNRKTCPLCPKKLNMRNSHGLCRDHYAKYRRYIFQERLSVCAGCPRLINRDNMFGRCVKCSRVFYRARDRALKVAA